jgi:hypothetical protein
MKKSLSLLAVCVLLIALCPLSASADLLPPPTPSPAPEAAPASSPLLPILLIAAAVLIVAFVLWRFLRKKA